MRPRTTIASVVTAGAVMFAVADSYAVSANTPAQRLAINRSSAHRWCRLHKCAGPPKFLFAYDTGKCGVSFYAAYTTPKTTPLQMIVCRPKR